MKHCNAGWLRTWKALNSKLARLPRATMRRLRGRELFSSPCTYTVELQVMLLAAREPLDVPGAQDAKALPMFTLHAQYASVSVPSSQALQCSGPSKQGWPEAVLRPPSQRAAAF